MALSRPIAALAQPATPAQEVARVAGQPGFHALLDWFHAHPRELAEWQMELTRIPAPPFGEQARAEWLRARFDRLGLKDVRIDEAGNALGVRPGTDKHDRYLAISAHLDTVFPAGTPLAVRREGTKLLGPGISDNGAGVTALLALAAALQETRARHAMNIVFIGNVGEEGEGDLRGMRHVFDGPWREKIAYTLVLDGAATDTVIAQALGSRRFEVTVRGPGGHSWSDHGTPNPVVALARAVARFSAAPAPNEPKTSTNVGVIRGGTSVNSIPEAASMRVDIRSAAGEEVDRLEQALREAVQQAVAETGADKLKAEIKAIGSRPAAELNAKARLLQMVQAVDTQLGNNSRLHRASTDANIPIALGLEALALGAGGAGGGAHTMHEWYDATHREFGLKRIALTVMTLAGTE